MEKLLIPALLLGSYFVATNRKKTTTSEVGAINRGRKTIDVKKIIDWGNSQLRRKDSFATSESFKAGISAMMHKILFDTNNYNGYVFIDNDDSDLGTDGYYNRIYDTRGLNKKSRSQIGALKVSDKKVIQAFVNQEPAEGKLLYTDGKTLEKLGMGRQNIANWSKDGQKIMITAIMDSKSTESVLRYMKKYIPKLIISKKTPISNFI